MPFGCCYVERKWRAVVIPRMVRWLHGDEPDFPRWVKQFIEDGRRTEVLMIARNARRLVWLHRKGVWRLPTGTVEHGERVRTCLPREVEEEFGVSLPVVAMLGMLQFRVALPQVPGAFTAYLFLLDAGDHQPQPVLNEGIDGWCLVTLAGLRAAAAQLRALPGWHDSHRSLSGSPDLHRSYWGAFRADEHEVVADLLAGGVLPTLSDRRLQHGPMEPRR
jgi:ADP-ribose pyrophosphatase YjhB (NUDIX family)